MNIDTIYIGNDTLKKKDKLVKGELVFLENEKFYKISNYDQMPFFLMSIVSDSDIWMFVSSSGALTAGRRDANNSIFPYYTDDRIHDSKEITGSKTILLVNKDNKTFLWQPFSSNYDGIYNIERNLYKNLSGNKLIFEETNVDLSVCFTYSWSSCDRFGIIKTSKIKNNSPNSITIKILDGILNILPAGTTKKFQLEFSTLLDAYKKNELIEDIGLGIYTLSSIPTDKAEPNESLSATIVWSLGLEQKKILLSEEQIELFKYGFDIVQETDIRAKRGAYLLESEFNLGSSDEKKWYIVTDLNKDHSDVAFISKLLGTGKFLIEQLENEIIKSSLNITRKVACADGIQLSNDSLGTFRHFSNVLFNIMRGGIFDNGYLIDKTDFLLFVKNANKLLWEKYNELFMALEYPLNFSELLVKIINLKEPDLERLFYEYMPLTFSRRHGDPSRPWNNFSICSKDKNGNKILNYEGNWRDIFQNWEALSFSFPSYIENMIVKFVNSSTADGYNPYKIKKNGFDWEVIDPSSPWSNIGYWGDHQVVYLSNFIELSLQFHPNVLRSMVEKEIFVYANVPYKLRTYKCIIEDPHKTIEFDFKLDSELRKRENEIGTDGKYLQDENGLIYHVNLTEKLLVVILTKLSNFIPEAGIWMNTQRPEWNDANNALVGNGVSMVTLYYLRRFIKQCLEIYERRENDQTLISLELLELFLNINQTLIKFKYLLDQKMSNQDRKKVLDELGLAGSNYREKIYSKGFTGEKKFLSIREMNLFFHIALLYIDKSIEANKRDDGLFHSYNLISFNNDGISIRKLYLMLEGQAAVLSSGFLSFENSIILLKSLQNSDLYRNDQSSYLLYPDRELNRFTHKNIISKELINQSPFLLKVIEENRNDDLIVKDINGNFHFNSRFNNAAALKKFLGEKTEFYKLPTEEKEKIINIYESIFNHQSFTGRSGTFYKYEGLGCIYWHMVSKLLLSVQKTFWSALQKNSNTYIMDSLKNFYYRIREGLGTHKSPEHYGAFPIDPYSHTPANMGAQQPGMTGQVKEDIISRFGELGLVIQDGEIHFKPYLLNSDEFLVKSQVFQYFDIYGEYQTLILNPGMIAFTFCQVPIIYIISNENKILTTSRDGLEKEINGTSLNLKQSKSIFERRGEILLVKVLIKI